MSDLPTENIQVKNADALIHSIVMGAAETAAVKAVKTDFPWLNLPIVNWVFDYFANSFFSYVSKFMETYAAFKIIDNQVEKERKDCNDAIIEMRSAKSEKELLAAQTKFKSSFNALVRNDGS